MDVPSLELRDGNKVPMLAFGTGTAWFKKAGDTSLDRNLVEITKTAIKRGFYHLDCAEMYGTEEEVGLAIKEAGVPREQLFITNKVSHSIEDIHSAIDVSLKKIQVDYFDLYLIHTPFFAKSEADFQRAWKSMEEIKKLGKAKSIGVSNYMRPDMEATLKGTSDPPVINQIEYHAYLQRANDYVPWLKQNNIQVGSFKGLTPAVRATDGPLKEPLARIAQAHNTTPSVVLLAWIMQSDIVAVTTTMKSERLDEYASALNVTLTAADMQEISDVGSTYHFRTTWVQRFSDDDRT